MKCKIYSFAAVNNYDCSFKQSAQSFGFPAKSNLFISCFIFLLFSFSRRSRRLRSWDGRKYFNFRSMAILRLLAMTFEIPIKNEVENTRCSKPIWQRASLNISFAGKLRRKFRKNWMNKNEFPASFFIRFARFAPIYLYLSSPPFYFAFHIAFSLSFCV